METRELFTVAYRAARVAVRDAGSMPVYTSQFSGALDATAASDNALRFRVCLAAERVARMHRTYRVRRNMRVMVRPELGARLGLLNYWRAQLRPAGSVARATWRALNGGRGRA